MKIRSLAVAALGLAIITVVPTAFAGAKDYEVQPVAADVKNGIGSEIAVRLLHKPTGKAVAGAVLFRTRLDMSPESMDEMTAKLVAIPSTEPDIYRFKADFTMAGGWALKLQAKVPGESESVAGTVVFKAK
jgi:hypothetical protein